MISWQHFDANPELNCCACGKINDNNKCDGLTDAETSDRGMDNSVYCNGHGMAYETADACICKCDNDSFGDNCEVVPCDGKDRDSYCNGGGTPELNSDTQTCDCFCDYDRFGEFGGFVLCF